MFGTSYMDALNLEEYLVEDRSRIPKITKVPRLAFNYDDADGFIGGHSTPKMILVSNQLPIVSRRVGDKWQFELDNDSIVLQLRDAFDSGTRVVFVGSLAVEIDDPVERYQAEKLLFRKFSCVPVFLSAELKRKFYHGFCKHYLWPLFHSMLPMTHDVHFNRDDWTAYEMANKAFVSKMHEVLDSSVDHVWIHDYHLMAMPTLIRKSIHNLRIGFFLHSPFPTSEIFRTIPVAADILGGFLNCDLVGFQIYDYARHFLSCCTRMMGLNFRSKRGYIGVEHLGRTVSVKILPIGVHMGQLDSVLSLPSTAEMVKQLKERYKGKIVMVGVDDMDLFKGIGLKFSALEQLFMNYPESRGKLVFIQITNPARSQGKDVQQAIAEANRMAEQVNRRYGIPEIGYMPIVWIKGPVTTQQKLAYYRIADCCVVNAVRDGMNLVPYKYTVSRQGNPVLDRALGVKDSAKESVIIVSEFIGCSPSLSGAIRVNPFHVDAVCTALSNAMNMKPEEKRLRHERNYKYISSHDIVYWGRSFFQDLQRACEDHCNLRFQAMGFGMDLAVYALPPGFERLEPVMIKDDYKAASNRLILLDYENTLIPRKSMDKTPSSQLIEILDALSSDPNNTVFIVSGRGKDSLSKWLSPCKKLGIAAEDGFYTRWTADSPWDKSPLAMDLEWQKIAEPIMQLYTEATDGSSIEKEESAMVWHHQQADWVFGTCQANELLDHLESVLANEPVVVRKGLHTVEVKPPGVSKGKVAEDVISAMRKQGKAPDFILCIGDDEDMFESIQRSISDSFLAEKPKVFVCTILEKPSMAQYFVNDTGAVIEVLESLAQV